MATPAAGKRAKHAAGGAGGGARTGADARAAGDAEVGTGDARGATARDEAGIHVSGGAIAGVFLLWRVWHRARRGMVALPDQAFLLNAAARVVQWGFLVAIVVAVITGYLLPWP